MTSSSEPGETYGFDPLRWVPNVSLNKKEQRLVSAIVNQVKNDAFSDLEKELQSEQELSGSVIECTLRQCPSEKSERVKSVCLNALIGKSDSLDLVRREMDINRRVTLAHLLADQIGLDLLDNFKELFGTATVDDRLALCQEIASNEAWEGYRDPHLRYPLVRQLRALAEENLTILKEAPKPATKAWPWILVNRLQSMGISKEVTKDFYDNVCSDSGFKECLRAKDLYDFLLGLISYDQLSAQENALLSKCLKAIVEDRERVMRERKKIEGKLQGKVPGQRGRVPKPGREEAIKLKNRLMELNKEQHIEDKTLPDIQCLSNIRANFTREEFFDILRRKQSKAEKNKI
ncbi:MAG: hypothetical protein K940chlam7_01911 [Chlamydiae bacterium]|nr:hypothetical protein [Chlamydiota bacterium]